MNSPFFSFQSFAQNKVIEKVEKIILNEKLRETQNGWLGGYSGKCGDYIIKITNATFFNENTKDDFDTQQDKSIFIVQKEGYPDFDLNKDFFAREDMSGVACVVYADKKINPILLMWTANGGNTRGFSYIARFQKIDLITKKITQLGEEPKQISKKLGFDIRVLDISYLK